MHITDGDLMDNTKQTNPKQDDKRNTQLKDGNKQCGGENAYRKPPAEQEELEIKTC
jgi:hypothetical protein